MIQDIIIVILIVILIFLFIWIILIKKNIRDLKRELLNTRKEDYNRQMKITLVDGDIESLASEINKNLDYQKNLKLETENSRRQLEQSISDIAHDLRTPLTVIKGNLQMLGREELTPEGRDYLDISRRKAESLKGMVDEFFELSVLESENKPVELCKLDITAFLSEFIVENETLIRAKNLVPEITFPEKSIFVYANKEMLSRVFSNLITNIFKYAKDSFELSIVEEKEGSSDGRKQCRIRVGNRIDDVNAIDIDHIFDRTYRADKARTDGSAGLGLYIARLLMTKQKGSINASLENDKLIFDIVLEKNAR